MRSALVLPLVWMSLLSIAGAQPPAAPVTVRVSLDRTAIWVGDRVQLTIELVSQPEIDVLAEDLASERLPVQGGEVLGVQTEQTTTADGLVRRMRYTITSYAVDAPQIVVDPFPVRYFSRRTADAGVQAAPAGQVVVPRRVIAVRSTLPEGERLPDLREPFEPRTQPRYLRSAQRVGLILIALAIVPVGLVVLDVAGRLRRARAGRPRRVTRRQQTTALEELSALDPDTNDDRIRALAALDRLVRDHLQTAAGIPAHALTPEEIRHALSARSNAVPADTIESLLVACERARYAPDPVSPETWSESMTTAKAILRGRTV